MAKAITIENAVITMVMNDITYSFNFVTNITLTDPRENTLTTSPQGFGNGVVYQTGTTQPVNNDFTLRDVQKDLHDALIKAYEEQIRVDLLIYDKNGGSTYECNKSIVRTNPSNATIAEGEEALNVPLNTSCPPNHWRHVPAED